MPRTSTSVNEWVERLLDEVALVTGGTKFEVIPSPRFVLSKAFGRATTL